MSLDSDYKISLDRVERFLHGHDDEKYIVNIEYDYDENLIHKIKHFPDGSKDVHKESLTAFLWAKDLSFLKTQYNFYNGSNAEIRAARQRYGVTITELETHHNDRLINGYRYIVKSTKGYNALINYFKSGGLYKLYNNIRNVKIKDNFIILTPVEQYLISTGKRLFKGYEEYNDIQRYVFDLETTGLNPEVDRIFLIGCYTNKGFEQVFDCETDGPNADLSEAKGIAKFFKTIEVLGPAIISGYNSANFDWNFLFVRCEKLGVDITDLAKTLSLTAKIEKRKQIIKYGNEVEEYEQVNMFGFSIIDIIHSTRRAQAIDSSMKFTNLKYVCKYNKVAKKNRVYIKGNKIFDYWKSDKTYYFDNITGSYLDKKPKFERIEFITREMVKNNPNKVFIFGDNDAGNGLGGQAKEMRGEPNSIGIPTKKKPDYDNTSFYSDNEFDENKIKINHAISQILTKVREGYDVVYPLDGVGSGLADLANKAPRTYQFLTATINSLEKYINEGWVEVDGKFIVKRYLIDDLWETMEVDSIYNQSSFMLSKLIPTVYQKVTTMGTAGLWKMLMLAWSYENNLAIPLEDVKRDFVGGLSRLLKVGYSEQLRKMDFNSLYPAIQLAHDIFPSVDTTGVMKSLLKYFHSERFKAKNLAAKYKKEGDLKLSSLYKRKQLPLKIFINSMYGALTAPTAFPWAEVDKGEQVTCSARQYLRLMVKFFEKKGYVATVMDTDGVNFMAPKGIEDNLEYIGKGLNSEVEKDKVYKGVFAVVAEFNDLYMQGEMGLGLDGMWPATANLKRKNYALLEYDGSISLTGNTIKSKKLPVYIEEFLDRAFVLLLNNKPYEFIQYYYSYIEKIYNKQIPLAKIATKAKVKKSVNDYINRGKNKNGAPLPMQAHMELIVKNNINVNLGDTIFYVNNGVKKSDGDVQTKHTWIATPKEQKQYYINKGKKMPPDNTETIINCYLLNEAEMEENPDKLGDYNASRYISMLNSRIKGLLVVFKKEIRSQILIEKPEDKVNWLKSELILCNGEPDEESDQDTLTELFTPEDREIEFWKKLNYRPDFWFDDEITFTLPKLNKKEKV